MAAPDLSEIVRLVQFTGHYFNFDESPRRTLLVTLQKLRVLYMVACNPFSLSSLFIGGLKQAMGIELFFGLMGFLTAMQHVHMYQRRKVTEDILRSMREIRRKYQPGSDDDLLENTRAVWQVVRFYFHSMTAILVFYIMLPKLVDWAYGVIWDDPIANRLPNSMDAFLEKEQQRNMKYVVVSFVSVSWSIISAYSHFGLDALLCLIVFYYASMVKTFCKSLVLDSNLTVSLKIRSLFGYPYALQNLFGSFCIVSLLYAMLSDESGGLLVLAANIVNFTMLLGMLTSTAYVGQSVTDVSGTIFEAIYNVPWYELRPSDRKYFVSMLCASREPMTINFLGRTPLNLPTFMAILNTAYSYFMYMRTVLK